MLTRTTAAKTAITLWALMVWAYRRQGVQYETDRAFELRAGAGGFPVDFLGGTCGQQRDGWEGRGCINGAGTTAHWDAHILHAIVRGLKPAKRQLIVSTASAGCPPVWDPVIPALRVLPMWKGPEGRIERVGGEVRVLGKLLSMYPGQRFPGDAQCGRHVGVGHWLRYEGCSDAEAAAIRRSAREDYARWWAALFEVYREVWFEMAFERWKISSIGVTKEPWKTAA
jgi:hypothetical protein